MNLFKKKDKRIIFLLNQDNLNAQISLVLAECIISEFVKLDYKCYCFYSSPFFILCEDLPNVFISDKSFEEYFVFEEIKKNKITEAFIITFDEKTLSLANKIKKIFNVKILNEPISERQSVLIENRYSNNVNLEERKIKKDKLITFFNKNPLSKIDIRYNKEDLSFKESLEAFNLNYFLSQYQDSDIYFKENIDYAIRFRVSFFLDKKRNYFIYSIGEYLLQDKEEILLFPAISLTKEIELKIEELIQILSKDKTLRSNLYSLDFSVNRDFKIFFKIYSDNLNIKNFVSNTFNFKYFISFFINFYVNHKCFNVWINNINTISIFEKELCKIIYLDTKTQNYKYFINKSIELNFYELELTVGKKNLKELKLRDNLSNLIKNQINISNIQNINEINNSYFISDKQQNLQEINLIIFIEDDISAEKRFFYKQIYKQIQEQKSIISTVLFEEILYASYLGKKFITLSNNTLIKFVQSIKNIKYYFLFGDLYLNLDIINDLRNKGIKNILKNDSIKFLTKNNINANLLTFSKEKSISNYVTDFKVIVIKNNEKISKIFINVLKENELYIVDDNFLNFWIKDLEEKKTNDIVKQIEDFRFLVIHYTCTDVDIILNSISFDLIFEIILYSNLINKNLISFILGNSNYITSQQEKLKEVLLLKRKQDNFLILKNSTISKIYFKMIKFYYDNVIANKTVLLDVNKVYYVKYFTICHFLIKENFVLFSEDEDFISEINSVQIKVFKYDKNIKCSVYIHQNDSEINDDYIKRNTLKLNHFLEVEFFLQGIRLFNKSWLYKTIS